MATITPANLYLQNVGSATLRIADMNTATNGDIWNSSIANIFSVISAINGTPQKGSATGVSWTASSGVINFQDSGNGNRLTVWVLSGFANK